MHKLGIVGSQDAYLCSYGHRGNMACMSLTISSMYMQGLHCMALQMRHVFSVISLLL